jgi:biofilm PGA synthesis N-glycosyltransferase PgaC
MEGRLVERLIPTPSLKYLFVPYSAEPIVLDWLPPDEDITLEFELEPSLPSPSEQIIVLVPAHNEEIGLAETIASIRIQTKPVDRLIVVSDNSTDRTVEIAKEMGCEVLESVDNTHKKAGALNQALAKILPLLTDTDRVLIMDADSELSPDFVRYACYTLDKNPKLIGAVSGAYAGKPKKGFIPLVQAMEYMQERRRIGRAKGKVTCLSGTAVVFSVAALRHLISERGRKVIGEKGEKNITNPRSDYYVGFTLTEDFEITLALKKLGYQPVSPKQCVVYTDLMDNLSMLWRQRLRWQRGTLETLWIYGFRSFTWRMWMAQIYIYLMTIIVPFMLTLWGISIWLHMTLVINKFYLLLLPLTALEQGISTRKLRSWYAVPLAVLLVPLWVMGNFRSVCYWTALWQALRRKDMFWD